MWISEGPLEVPGLTERNQFGADIEVQMGHIMVSAPGANGFVGTVFVFGRSDDGTWEVVGNLYPFDGQPGDNFGAAIALGGNEVWIGAPGAARQAGRVYVVSSDPESHELTGVRRLGADVLARDRLGTAIAVSGDLAAAAVQNDDYGLGSVAVFEREDGEWRSTSKTWVDYSTAMAPVLGGQVDCEGGKAAAFDCNQVDLVSFLPVSALGGTRGVELNDVWGWTDPQTQHEYALVGRYDATSFVDITDPFNPVYLGFLPMTDGAWGTVWRDIKVYKNHAYIVSDGAGPHGIQVFDLTELRNVTNAPVEFEETAHYDQINSAHNIVINEETGFAYSVGSSQGGETCGGGLHMIDIRDPGNPTFAGCFADPTTGRRKTGYSHDAQCVVYHGPDNEYEGREICFGANETALSIADVTDKENPVSLSMAEYPNVGYAHQGWVTDDHRYFFMNDELDELQGSVTGTRTLVWDINDLDDPVLVKEFFGTTEASDHNLYIVGNLMYQSHYFAGFRIVDISDPTSPREVAYFDTVPGDNNKPGFGGSWSNYPYFSSGVIVVTSGQEGLFLLKKKETLIP
jgi:choice-of-anchor B domain-containing protein